MKAMSFDELVRFAMEGLRLTDLHPTFEPVDFAVTGFDGEYEHHYGIKQVELPFDNDDQLLLVCDYYGGGCAHAAILFCGLSERSVREAITRIVSGAILAGEGHFFGQDNKLYVQRGVK